MRVFIASPHRLLREALAQHLAARHELVGELDAEIAVCDLCALAPKAYPPPPVQPSLALICGPDLEAVEVLKLGYRGVFRFDEGSETLDRALQALLRGENWAERHLVAAALETQKSPLTELTKREESVYQLVVAGLNNAAIADELELSVNTVKVHISNILHKLAAKSRAELILRSR